MGGCVVMLCGVDVNLPAAGTAYDLAISDVEIAIGKFVLSH